MFFSRDHEFERVEKSVSRVIEICGFIDITDIASPPFVSRHLLLPTGTGKILCYTSIYFIIQVLQKIYNSYTALDGSSCLELLPGALAEPCAG